MNRFCKEIIGVVLHILIFKKHRILDQDTASVIDFYFKIDTPKKGCNANGICIPSSD